MDCVRRILTGNFSVVGGGISSWLRHIRRRQVHNNWIWWQESHPLRSDILSNLAASHQLHPTDTPSVVFRATTLICTCTVRIIRVPTCAVRASRLVPINVFSTWTSALHAVVNRTNENWQPKKNWHKVRVPWTCGVFVDCENFLGLRGFV